jgi:hypothetical protein
VLILLSVGAEPALLFFSMLSVAVELNLESHPVRILLAGAAARIKSAIRAGHVQGVLGLEAHTLADL